MLWKANLNVLQYLFLRSLVFYSLGFFPLSCQKRAEKNNPMNVQNLFWLILIVKGHKSFRKNMDVLSFGEVADFIGVNLTSKNLRWNSFWFPWDLDFISCGWVGYKALVMENVGKNCYDVNYLLGFSLRILEVIKSLSIAHDNAAHSLLPITALDTTSKMQTLNHHWLSGRAAFCHW